MLIREEIPRAKILMLHGNGQSADTFQKKMNFLHQPIANTVLKSLLDGAPPSTGKVEFVYVDGPISTTALDRCTSRDSLDNINCNLQDLLCHDERKEFWMWGYGDSRGEEVSGMEKSIARVISILNNEGPFTAIIGFSAGAALAALVSSLLETPREVPFLNMEVKHPPLSFVIAFSGFLLGHKKYRELYQPKARTPIIHFIGELDFWVPERQTLQLVRTSRNAQIHHFMGVHFVPRARETTQAVLDFVGEALVQGFRK